MSNARNQVICLAGLVVVGCALAASAPQESTAASAVQVIEINADKYAFSPAEIHVKEGAKVQLKLHSIDKEHGLKISIFPEGAKKSGPPGLRFEGKNDTGKVHKGSDGMIEFIAVQHGTYRFECSIFCGLGHGRMKGKLVVDD